MTRLPYEKMIRLRRTLVEDPMSGQSTLSDWTNAQTKELDEVLFSPGTSIEFPNVDLEALSALAVLYLPLGTDVTAEDRICIRDALWSVEGRRADWADGGSTVNLKHIRDLRDGTP